MQIASLDFQACLDAYQPRIGRYGWMWLLLRARGARSVFASGLYTRLLALGNPRRPYFVGRTASGVLFLGDYREPEAAAAASGFTASSPLMQFVSGRLERMRGALLDIGCGSGRTTAALIRRRANHGEALAFEADATPARMLAATLALNSVTNARLFPVAVGDYDGTVGAGTPQAGVAATIGEGSACEPAEILCRTLDSLFHEGSVSSAALVHLDRSSDVLRTVHGARSVVRQYSPAFAFTHIVDESGAPGPELNAIANALNSICPYNMKLIRPASGSEAPGLVTLGRKYPAGARLDLFCEPAPSQHLAGSDYV